MSVDVSDVHRRALKEGVSEDDSRIGDCVDELISVCEITCVQSVASQFGGAVRSRWRALMVG